MKKESVQLPWGRVAGLLAGCCVTMIGVVLGLEPATILLRAVIAAVVVGVFAVFIAAAVRTAATERNG